MPINNNESDKIRAINNYSSATSNYIKTQNETDKEIDHYLKLLNLSMNDLKDIQQILKEEENDYE